MWISFILLPIISQRLHIPASHTQCVFLPNCLYFISGSSSPSMETLGCFFTREDSAESRDRDALCCRPSSYTMTSIHLSTTICLHTSTPFVCLTQYCKEQHTPTIYPHSVASNMYTFQHVKAIIKQILVKAYVIPKTDFVQICSEPYNKLL